MAVWGCFLKQCCSRMLGVKHGFTLFELCFVLLLMLISPLSHLVWQNYTKCSALSHYVVQLISMTNKYPTIPNRTQHLDLNMADVSETMERNHISLVILISTLWKGIGSTKIDVQPSPCVQPSFTFIIYKMCYQV